MSVKLTWHGPQFEKAILSASHQAVLEAGADLQQRSADEAPIDLGDLRGNAGIDDSELGSEGFIMVGYNLVYALRQHEEMSYSHPQGGKAKYLEDPYNAKKDDYMKHIANAVDEAAS